MTLQDTSVPLLPVPDNQRRNTVLVQPNMHSVRRQEVMTSSPSSRTLSVIMKAPITQHQVNYVMKSKKPNSNIFITYETQNGHGSWSRLDHTRAKKLGPTSGQSKSNSRKAKGRRRQSPPPNREERPRRFAKVLLERFPEVKGQKHFRRR